MTYRIVSPSLQLEICEKIGKKTRYELAKTLSSVETNGVPIIVDTIFNAYSNHHSSIDSQDKEQYYVLFDHNSILFYHTSLSSQPCIHCILDHIKRNYNPRKWKTLAKYYNSEPYEFNFGFTGIPVVWNMLEESKSENVFLCLNCLSAELRQEPALFSGNCNCMKRDQEKEVAFLRDHLVDEDLRIDRNVVVPNVLSEYSGIVAKQSIFYDTSSLPTGIARVGYGIKELEDICGGRAFSDEAAKDVATYESIERLHLRVISVEEERFETSYKAISEDAINPEDLMFQKLTPAAGSNLYSPELKMQWTKCVHMLDTNQKWVPSQAVWISRKLLSEDTLCIANTSNGCALGGSLEEAILYGLFELIERDNFLLAWYCRRPCRQIEPHTDQHESFHLLNEKL